MALIGEMKYLQIGSNVYEIPTSELPIASSSTLGGIKVGTNLSIDSSTGVLSVTGIPTKTSDLTNDSGFITGITILSYGSSTWDDFITAYNANKVVYCRASSNSNPASGSQTRLAFMAYVNDATTPTNVEFQYYRSVSSHTESQQGDQVFVYKLDKTSGWSVTTREASVKVAYNNGITGTYSNGVMTLKHANTAITAQTTQGLYPITIDAYGHITGYGTAVTSLPASDVSAWAKAANKPTYTASEVGAVATNKVGAANGVVPLNASSKIDETYLPSYVDDVVEGYYYNNKFYKESSHTTEITGEAGKIYIDLATDKTYRYGGTTYAELVSGSVVSVSRDLTTGTKSATITVNGTGYDIYSVTNTDKNVAQSLSTSDSSYAVLLRADTGTTDSTDETKYSSKFTVQPSTGNITVGGTTTSTGLITGNGGISTTVLTTSSNTTIGGTLDVSGVTTLGSLNVTNNTAIGGNLEITGGTTFNGVLDVTNRRCEATLSSAGWYRVCKITNIGGGDYSFAIDLNICRQFYYANNEQHSVRLVGISDNFSFVNEDSKSNTQIIKRIRYTRDSNNNGYVDIYYDFSNANIVYCEFAAHGFYPSLYTIESLQAVADAPSGETVLTTYEFSANGIRTVTLTSAHSSVTINGQKVARSGQVVSLWVDFTVSSSISGYDYLINTPTFATAVNALVYNVGNTIQTTVRLYADEGNIGLRCYGSFPAARYIAFITYITTDV